MGFTSFLCVPIWLASQTMGVGTLFPPGVVGNDVKLLIFTSRLRAFWPQLLLDGETRVSCLLVTAVQTRVHITFPVPFTLAIYLFLANRFGDDSRHPGVCGTQIVYP